jgi:hypothetical protein
VEIPFVGQAYQARSESVSAQRCVNLYLEQSPEGGRTRSALYPTPGLKLLSTLAAMASALRVVNGRLFAIVGSSLIEVGPTGTQTVRGVISSTGYAKLTDNGIQLLILTGAIAYSFNIETNVLSAISSVHLNTATQATVIDGYGVFAEANSQRIRVTSPYDFTTVDPTDFASAEGLPDNVVAIASLNRELWIFGEKSTEIWFNSGAANFPFERNSNTFLEYGIAAVRSVSKLDGALYWVGRGSDGRANILRASGYQPEIIAHHGIAEIIEREEQLGGLSLAYSFAYRERGHAFYALTLPLSERTVVYDAVTQSWHERSYLNQSLGREVQHLADHCVTLGGRTIVSTVDGRLCEMTEDSYSDVGEPIIRTRVCPVIAADQRKLKLSSLELLVEAGVGVANGQGSNPLIQMRQSVDGGKSFGDWHMRSLGGIGETLNRVIFRRLGIAVNRVIEVRVSDPVKWVFMGATVNIKAG